MTADRWRLAQKAQQPHHNPAGPRHRVQADIDVLLSGIYNVDRD